MSKRLFIVGAALGVFAAVCFSGERLAGKGVSLVGTARVDELTPRSRLAFAEHLRFMPAVGAPPPVAPVHPAGYSNNLELVEAAVNKCNSITNMTKMAHAERNARVQYWVSVFRTNGIPKEFRGMGVKMDSRGRY